MVINANARTIALLGGAALLGAALLTSSPSLLALLAVAGDGEDAPRLLLGATFFRIGLALLGVAVIAMSRWSIWHAVPAAKNAPVEPGAAVRHETTVRATLVALLTAAFALRLYGLDAGLWLDEILTRALYVSLPLGEIVTKYESENQHFLYTLLAHVSLALFGDTAWALRLPAALFGVASIWALYLLGREVAGAAEALLASALLTFSYTHVWFSQNARGYSGLLFFAVLSSWLLLRALDGRRPSWWLLYAVVAALGLYLHVTMLFVVAAQFLWYLLQLGLRRRATWPHRSAGLFLGFGFAGLLTCQLYALVLPQLVGSMGREESVVDAWKNPLWTLLEVARGLQISLASGVVVVVALAVFGAGLGSYARTRPEVVWLLFVPAAMGATLVIALGHHLWPRFFFFELGFGVLVVIRGALVVGTRVAQLLTLQAAPSTMVRYAPAVALILVSLVSVPRAYGPKQDYLGAAAFVEASLRPGDAVTTTGLAAFPYQQYYRRDWSEIAAPTDLDRVRSRANRIWLIYTFPPVLEAVQPDLMASIRREFEVVGVFKGTVGGGDVYVARLDSRPATRRAGEESASHA